MTQLENYFQTQNHWIHIHTHITCIHMKRIHQVKMKQKKNKRKILRDFTDTAN